MRRGTCTLGLGAILVTALAVACGAFTSTDPPVTQPDASAAVDGGFEASAPPDSGLPADGGTDACPPGAAFCDDFERGPTIDLNVIKGAWDEREMVNGSLGINGGPEGRALDLSVRPVAAGPEAKVFLRKNFAPHPKQRFEVRFKVMLTKAPTAQVQVASLTLFNGDMDEVRISLEVTGTALGVQERLRAGGNPPSEFGPLLPLGLLNLNQWAEVALEMENLDNAGRQFRGRLGASASNGTPLRTTKATPSKGVVLLGDQQNGLVGANASLRYDDVVVIAR